ncbi:MAG: bifunctional UDP-N-acetylmuramoyl-tripeptide:D-alanyl-D-alanine ligase/alanine racemase [Prevotella sp.]|uniref:bifunctional UDP-N-acetylmuramoyl-tripeptide:D-alanyl-D-alanine ligase/alanine racemase n=1 Tax=Prevotella sp. TaxID=59823 RepID=UPI002A2A236C|nr:bifunctional UDP-N-acetylmuramoyl-tripeptide:D-alanyl-D-alanine ligase/alanine racemase [Prevotella sp.]MDD7317374.1 bifunctional UDP-N-acetylmuramoyl-tripeptide:D-alanyl-D-alanine ligase/alanine racemase [Prevotellaceae bacterium]MDY4019472.1 bifunctional UDP-N-acetylmuramoyl-tripeptide:D-alanyl-D-alanine ligase/alanine racemase [Prevotella sp.]
MYTIEKITVLTGAERYGDKDADIGWLLTDSRSLRFPEATLFFAIKTERNDGGRYLSGLYRSGVRNFVVEKLPENHATTYPDSNFLLVGSTLKALQRLAERHRENFHIPVVGITGSNGKTVVKEWLYQLLMPTRVVTRSPRSYNSQIGVPLSVWLLDDRTEIGLFEAGISMPGEMPSLGRMIRPTIGVITNIGPAHQENFATKDEKCREKMSLFSDAEVVFYNAEDETIRNNISALKCKTVPFSPYEGDMPFIDRASKENAGACAAVAAYLGMTAEQIAEGMKKIEPVAMRLEVKQGQHGCILINDSYNSDINSLDIALDFMQRRHDLSQPDNPMNAAPKLSRTLILSDIYQSGMPAEALYREVSKLARERGVRKFIGIGEEISSKKDMIDIGEKRFFNTTEEFLASETLSGLRDEIILIKGARRFSFDRITERLEQKVHETILEVNLNAVVENLNHFRSFLHPDTKIACMIKADGYGSGAVEVAKTLQDHRVDYLAVAVADEGVTLRKAGITGNIMIMNPETTAFKAMFDHALEPEVYSFRLLEELIAAARKEGIAGYPVHIKLDTGMHRLGFNPREDMPRLIERLKHQVALTPRSVFSHFVGADSDDFDSFSEMQFNLFDEASRRLQEAFPHKILRHIDNSAGIEHFPERQLDMCRLGIGLYGVDSRDNRILNNVCTLKTTILQMRHVPKGETVGYSRRGVLSRDSVIAAIPIGYADGLNRRLGRGRGYCLVNGMRAPYVGNICMDVAMIDVTGIDCHEGDTVEIFGDHLPVTVLSDALETIPYEVLTGISNRVKRVYFQD